MKVITATRVINKEGMISIKKTSLEVRRLQGLLRHGWRKETQGQRHQVFGAMTALLWVLNGASGDWVPEGHFDFKKNKHPLRHKLERSKKGYVVKVPRLPTVI